MVRIIGPSKEVMFTQDQLMLRVHAIRGAITPILWENPGYRPMDQEITLYIFNIS
jgi:hypothetical protein